ncbi:hypothetical protein HMPREF3291_08600 [Bacillus sp. HMSC76G11]|nr:hypothetical protein HMPREF3291_08600 [Bacillus sp. HMSC76G11]
MGTKYFTENDVNNKRRSFYNFYKDKETGGLRAFNGLNEELTFSEIQEIIEGLTTSYLNISEKEYANRTLNQIKYDVDYSFSECNQGPPTKKYFRKDLKRHYSIKCVNCLKEISTKSNEGYWIAQSYHKRIYGEKFCSEWCLNKYIDEIKQTLIKEKKLRYGL